MGLRNYLIEGVSGTGKTSVAEALQRRGYDVVHGDRDLAYWGDPATGKRLASAPAELGKARHLWLWDVTRVRALAAGRTAIGAAPARHRGRYPQRRHRHRRHCP